MTDHYFFHLHNAEDVIFDEIGVEVSGLDQVDAALAEAIEEMQREQYLKGSDLEGWEMRVVDTAGIVVMAIPLEALRLARSSAAEFVSLQ